MSAPNASCVRLLLNDRVSARAALWRRCGHDLSREQTLHASAYPLPYTLQWSSQELISGPSGLRQEATTSCNDGLAGRTGRGAAAVHRCSVQGYPRGVRSGRAYTIQDLLSLVEIRCHAESDTSIHSPSGAVKARPSRFQKT